MGGIGVAFLAGFLVVFNIVMWLVLLAKFKKFFTTDDIIESTRAEMDKMIADVNRNTDRDISLIEDRLRDLKAVIAEADRHVTVAHNELEKQSQAQFFAHRLQQQNTQATPSRPLQHTASQRAAEQYRRGALGFQPTTYAVTSAGKKHVVQQGDLFEEAEPTPAPNVFTVVQDGAAYTSMPIIGPNVTFADEPIVPKKDFSTQVRERYDRGESIDEIATALGRSTTEVQFALDMGA